MPETEQGIEYEVVRNDGGVLLKIGPTLEFGFLGFKSWAKTEQYSMSSLPLTPDQIAHGRTEIPFESRAEITHAVNEYAH